MTKLASGQDLTCYISVNIVRWHLESMDCVVSDGNKYYSQFQKLMWNTSRVTACQKSSKMAFLLNEKIAILVPLTPW